MRYKGIAYYPEHWNKEVWDKDLKRIEELGVNTIRIGEFMWSLLEPKEGEFDFSLLDEMIEVISNRGFKILIGTPTATFPVWVLKHYQNILAVDASGGERKYGTRRQYCYNSKDYLRLSKIITKKVVERYADNENVIGFQIDNELGHEGSDYCQCSNCKDAFQKFLKDKYESIDELNKVCGNVFWGQNFLSFDDITIPFGDLLGHNPTLRLEYARFLSQSLVNFGNVLIDITNKHKKSNQFVTTNLPGGLFNKWFNPNDLSENIDFVSFDNYPIWGGETNNADDAKVAMELDMVRGLKNQKFWIVEELIGAQGHDYVGWLPRQNQARLWAMQAHLRGAENIFFFRYKGLNKGEEQFCQGIFDVDDRLNDKFDEVKAFFEDTEEVYNTESLKMKNKVAMIYDYDNIWSWKIQPQSKNFDFSKEFLKYYRSLYELNVNADVIDRYKPFDSYDLIIVPFMQVMADDFKKKIEAFLSEGKTVIFGYRSGIRNENNNMPLGINPLESYIGAEIQGYEALGKDTKLTVSYKKENYNLSIWRDILKPVSSEVLVNYSDYSFSDHACVVKNKYNNGHVYYFGASLPCDLSTQLFKEIFENHKIDYSIDKAGLEMIKLYQNEKIYEYNLNHEFYHVKNVLPVSYIRR